MQKMSFGLIACLLLLVFCIGCEKKISSNTIDKDYNKNELIEKAIIKFDEINGIQAHKEYNISVTETTDEWNVYFDGKVKLPGNHALVIIDNNTGEVEYFKGE